MSGTPEGERGGVSPPSLGESERQKLGGLTPPRSPRPRRLRLVAVVTVLGVFAGFATWYFLIRAPEPRNDVERFRGDWQIAIAGRDTPNVIRVEGDRWQYQAGPTDGKAFRLTLSEAASPREIELELIDAPKLVGPPVKIRGVYVFDGNNTARLRINPAPQPRPTTLDDPDAMEWVLTRVKLQPAP